MRNRILISSPLHIAVVTQCLWPQQLVAHVPLVCMDRQTSTQVTDCPHLWEVHCLYLCKDVRKHNMDVIYTFLGSMMRMVGAWQQLSRKSFENYKLEEIL
ncbi:UNVERIFIED_CONTAM: hypothetical protein K2H54_035017 [Gekko kuhli]